METEELCSINISPLVTNPFTIQWSPDNQISIITEKVVHIFELEPSPMSPDPTIKFTRSIIYPSDVSPMQTLAKEVDPSVLKLRREEVSSLFKKEMCMHKLDMNNANLRIVKVAWSPKDLISQSRCTLAILTAAGTVELLHKVSNEWYSICDISSLRLNIVLDDFRSSLTKCKKLKDQLTMLVENMRRLQACSLMWSELFKVEKTSFAYFTVAYCNGDILIWKVPRISNFNVSLQPVLVGRVDLNISVEINALCWITINANEYLLVVGYFDGRICSAKLRCNGDDLQTESTENYMDPDRIAVNYLRVIHQDEANVKILAVKGTFLMLIRLSRTGTWKSMQYLQVEGCITGITPIAEWQFLITTQYARIFMADTQHELISVDVKSHLPQTREQYLGLAQSPSRVIFVNVTSPNMTYDHLLMREPSILHLFTLKGEKWDPLFIVDNSASLTNVWDCMEVLRLRAVKAEDPSTVLRPTTERVGSPSLYEQQVSMWMTVVVNVCNMKKPIPNMDHIRQSGMSRMLPSIFVHCTCAYLDVLTKRSALSESQTLTVSLLRRYLKVYLADLAEVREKDNDARIDVGNNDGNDDGNDDVRRRGWETLNATASHPDRTERCNLCDDAIDESFWNVTSCPSGHKLSRCSVTLLQITSLEYLVCPICRQIFHSCLEEVYEEPRCHFCDVPVLFNEYAIDVEESELYGRNWSRANIALLSKEQDTEELNEK